MHGDDVVPLAQIRKYGSTLQQLRPFVYIIHSVHESLLVTAGRCFSLHLLLVLLPTVVSGVIY